MTDYNYDSYSVTLDDISTVSEAEGYALAAYFIYFFGFSFCMRTIDKAALFDRTVHRLARSAETQYLIFQHELQARRKERERTEDVILLGWWGDIVFEENLDDHYPDFNDSGTHLEELECDEVAYENSFRICTKQPGISRKESVLASGYDESVEVRWKCCTGYLCRLLCGCKDPRRRAIEYDQHFLMRLLEKQAYFNIRSDLRCGCCCCCTCFKSSYCSDMYFYLLNHSQLLGMIAALPEHPFTREQRRMAYMLQQSIAFCFASVLASIDFQPYELRYYYGGQEAYLVLDSEVQKTLINVLIISPFIMALYSLLFMLFSCPCTKFNFRWPLFKRLRDFIEGSGDLVGTLVCIVVSLLCVAYVSLFDAASWTTISYARLEMLVTYALQVQLSSAVIDSLRCLLVFTPFFVDIKICGIIPLLRMGDWVGQMRMSKSARYGTKPPSHVACCLQSCTLDVGAWSFDRNRKKSAKVAPLDTRGHDRSDEHGGVSVPQPYLVRRYERHLRQDILSKLLEMVRRVEGKGKVTQILASEGARVGSQEAYDRMGGSNKRVTPSFRLDSQEAYELEMRDFFASTKSDRDEEPISGADSPRMSPQRATAQDRISPSPSKRSPVTIDIEASSPAPLPFLALNPSDTPADVV